MKKFGKILMMSLGLSLFAGAGAKAQEVVVRARLGRPHGVVVVRPVRPSPRHVWVGEEWTPGGGTYVYHAGYWAEPPRPRAVWVNGHWGHRPRGYVWIPGHWR